AWRLRGDPGRARAVDVPQLLPGLRPVGVQRTISRRSPTNSARRTRRTTVAPARSHVSQCGATPLRGGDDNAHALLTAADAAIVLRNNGFKEKANLLLHNRLRHAGRSEGSTAILALTRCRILDQLAWNSGHDDGGRTPRDPRMVQQAERYAQLLLGQAS